MRLSPDESRRRATLADHGVLSTSRPDGSPDSVPVCFVIDGDLMATPIDTLKPKSGRPLQRVANVDADPRATLLCEHWDADDWSRLWWARLRLRRTTPPASDVVALETALRRRYPQYAGARFAGLLTFTIVEASGWAAAIEDGAAEARHA
jgi:PPOX class probable F420-dependent enzyme